MGNNTDVVPVIPADAQLCRPGLRPRGSSWSASQMAVDEPRRGRLVVVRHGSTHWSRTGRHTGRTDVPLDAEGRLRALELAPRLAGHRFARVLVSPLARARETCALAGFEDVAEVCPELAEWDYGDYEGRTTAEIRSEHPAWTLWDDGAPGGETIEQVGARASRVVEAARQQHGDVLAFGHGHCLRVVAATWLGLAPVTGRALLLGTAALGVLAWEREMPALGRWDDHGGDPLN